MSEPEKKKIEKDGVIIEVDTNLTRKLAQQNQKLADEKAQTEKTVSELQEENEDLRDKLGIIAERELEKKRKAISERATSLLKNPEKRTEMLEKIKTESPEQLQNTEAMLGILEKELGKGEEHKSIPSGSAELVSQQYGGQQEKTDLLHRRFDTIEQAIQVLRSEKAKGNPEAEPLLKKLFEKGIQSWRNAGHPSQAFSPDDSIEKTTSTPEINLDSMPDSEIPSEIEKFGVKKSPHKYAQKTRPDGQPKKEGE